MRHRLAIAVLVAFAAMAWPSSALAIAPGDFDPSFGSNGVFYSQLSTAASPETDLRAVALQPDGKLLAGGLADQPGYLEQFLVERLNPDGSLDPSFGSGGKVLTQLGPSNYPGSQVNAIAVQPDGKILAAGWVNDSSDNALLLVVRLNTDGSFDPSFGTGGEFAMELGAGTNGNQDSEARAIALQPDGKILVDGQASESTGPPEFLWARLNPNGTLDTSFNSGGKVVLQVDQSPSPSSWANALALQPDGKILGAGYDANQGSGLFAVVRLNSDGSFDSSFGNGGTVTRQLGVACMSCAQPYSEADALALQPDGRILASGRAQDANGNQAVLVARLNSDGSFDPSFGTSGVVLSQLSPYSSGPTSEALALALQPNGRILAGGDARDANGNYAVLGARLNSDGSLDSSFGSGGKVIAQLGSGTMPRSHVDNGAAVLQPDGKVVFAGSAGDNNTVIDQGFVARMIADLPPTASSTAAPTTVQVGQPVTFSGSGSDPDGSIASYSWSFGDGAMGSGATAGHAYAAPGSYTATLTVRDDYGLAATSVQTITVKPIPAVTPITIPSPPVVLAPALGALRVSPAAFPAAAKGASIARKTGATVSYRDSQAATTSFTVLSPQKGVRQGKRCVKPPRKRPKGKRLRSCTRYVSMGGFSHRDVAGANRFHFTGRVGRRKLKPGSYQLAATPRAHGVSGKTVTTRFRIIR